MTTTTDALRLFLSRLPADSKLKRKGDGYMACCPAHDDRNPSLSIDTNTTGDVLLSCFAGCSAEAIVAAMGMTMAELFATEPDTLKIDVDDNTDDWTPTGSPATATYEYVDEDGVLLYGVCRTADKQFPQWRPDPTKQHGRAWNLDGVRRVLYHLPQLIEGVQQGQTIYIPEGEKDVHAFERAGEVATCNPGGAGKWRGDEFAGYFGGADVIIIADKDEPGRKHAIDIMSSMVGVATTVKVMEAAEGKDAADHLAAGYTVEEFVGVGSGEEFSALGSEGEGGGSDHPGVLLSDVEAEEVEWLWRDRIPRGKITLLDGDPGLAKSTITMDLAARVSTGRAMPDGAPGLTGGVVVLSAEDGLHDTIRPRLDAAGADTTRIVALPTVGEGDDERLPSLPEDLANVEAAARRVDAVLIIIDPLMAFLGGDVNAHKDQDVRRALAQISRLAERTGAAILILRHLNKSTGGKAIYRGGGSIGIGGAARSVLLAAEDPDNEGIRVLASVKSNLAATPPSLQYRTVEAENGAVAIDWMGRSEHRANQLLAASVDEQDAPALAEAKEFVRELLRDGPLLASEVEKQRKSAQISGPTLRRAREALGVTTTPIRESGGPGITGWKWRLGDGLDDHAIESEGGLHDQPSELDHLNPDPYLNRPDLSRTDDHLNPPHNGLGDQAQDDGHVNPRATCAGGCGAAVSSPGAKCHDCAREAIAVSFGETPR